MSIITHQIQESFQVRAADHVSEELFCTEAPSRAARRSGSASKVARWAPSRSRRRRAKRPNWCAWGHSERRGRRVRWESRPSRRAETVRMRGSNRLRIDDMGRRSGWWTGWERCRDDAGRGTAFGPALSRWASVSILKGLFVTKKICILTNFFY